MSDSYNITGQNLDVEQIVDIVPEQEKSDAQIQASEENYLRALEKNGEDRIRNNERTWEGIAKLSSTVGDVIKKKQEKFRQDREAQIKLDMLTRGVSPEVEALFKGERESLFQTDLATQEFASKYESETGDSITANEFRKMAGWEKYMVAEQYALQKAKGYDQYVYEAYKTTKIDVIRDGVPASVGHMDTLSPQEQAALDTKIKFEYAKQFAGLNDTLVATVVKPEIDKFDANRRKNQAVQREKAYQIQVKESDDRMIEVGFSTANPADGHELAHKWASRYAARNQTTVQVGRIAFAESLVDLVAKNKVTYTEAMSIVNHEIEARDGSIKTMTSWREWDGLGEDLAEAAKKGTAAREELKSNEIAGDLQVIKSMTNLTNAQKMQMYAVYQDKYDGYVPSKLQGALRGHIDDDSAEDMIQESIRYQGGVYDFELANVSTEIYNKYKDKLITSGSTVPGTDAHKKANEWIKSYTDVGYGDVTGDGDTKNPRWLSLNESLTELYFSTYKDTLYRNGQKVATEKQADDAAKLAIQQAVDNPETLKQFMSTDFSDDGDETYNRLMQVSMTQSGGGGWRENKITANKEIDTALVRWYNTPLKQSKDLPSYYKDLAMRIGVNPIDLANSQVKYLVEDEVKVDKVEEKYNDTILNLIYKFPTRERITRARLEAEGAGDQNVKTSIYNRTALTIKDE